MKKKMLPEGTNMLAGMLALLGRVVNMFVSGATAGLDGLPAAITSTYCFLAPDTEQHSYALTPRQE